MEKKEFFADGVNQVHFCGSMIRFDFVSLQPENKETDQPKQLPVATIIMPPQGFLSLLSPYKKIRAHGNARARPQSPEKYKDHRLRSLAHGKE